MALAEEATNAEGNALANQEKYQDSYSGRLQDIATSWETFWLSIYNNGFTSAIIDVISTMLSGLNKLADVLGAIPLLISAIAAGAATVMDIGVGNLGAIFSTGSSNAYSEQLATDEKFLMQYSESVGDAKKQQDLLSNSQLKASDSAKQFAAATKGSAFSIGEFTKTQTVMARGLDVVAIKAKVASVAVGVLNAVANMGLSLVLMALVEAAIWAGDQLIVTSAEIAENYTTAKDKVLELSSAFKELSSTVSSSKDRFAELSQGVNQLTGENISLSTDDYQEFIDLNTEIIGVIPNATTTITAQGDAFLSVSGNIGQVTSALEAYESAARKATNSDLKESFGDIYKGFSAEISDAQIVGVDLTPTFSEEEVSSFKEDMEKNINEILNGQSVKIDTSSYYGQELQTALYDIFNTDYGVTLSQGFDDSLSYDGDELLNTEENFSNATKSIEFYYSYLSEVLGQYNKDISDSNNEILKSMSTFNDQFMSIITTDDKYNQLTKQYGDSIGSAIQLAISGINFKEDMNFKTDTEVLDYVDKEVYDALLKASPKIRAEFTSIFTDATIPVDTFEQYYNDIAAWYKDRGVEIPVYFTTIKDSEVDVQNRFNEFVKGFSNKDQSTLSKYAESKGIDSSDEYEYFMNVTDLAGTAEEAIASYELSIEEASTTSADSLSTVNDVLDSIQSAYKLTSSAVAEYATNGFLSLDTIQSLIDLDDVYIGSLIDENGQLQVNKDTYIELTKAQLNSMKIAILSDAGETLTSLQSEAGAREYLKVAIDNQNASEISLLDTKIKAYKYTMLLAGGMTKDQQLAVDNLRKNTVAQLALVDASTSSLLNNTDSFFGVSDTSAKDAQDAAKDAADAIKDAFDSAYDRLNALRDAGAINEKDYLDQLKALNKEYYGGKAEFVEEFYKYEKEYYDGLIDMYDTVVSAVERVIDKQIDSLKDSKEDVENYYNSIIEANEAKIKVYDDEIVAIEDANDARQRALDLEENLYNIKKLENQRSKFSYSGGQFVYGIDEQALKSAKETLEQSKVEQQIADLEKLKESLETANSDLEASLKVEQDAIDANVQALEDYKEEWTNVANETQNIRDEEIANMILGADWENEVLGLRLDNLNAFKVQYLAIQQEMINAAKAYSDTAAAASAADSASASSGGGGAAVTPTSPQYQKENPAKINSTKKYKFNGATYPTEAAAIAAQSKYILSSKPEAAYTPYLLASMKLKYPVSAYAKGGIVGEEVLKKTGEDQIAAVSYGEGILTPEETKAYIASAPKIPELVESVSSFISDGMPPSWLDFISKLSSVASDTFAFDNGLIKGSKNYGVSTNTVNEKSITIEIGDIYLTGTENVGDLAKSIVAELPNLVLQEINKQ